MSKLEDDIRKALLSGPSEEELKELTEEKAFFAEIGVLFKGRNRWLTIMLFIFAVLFGIAGLVSIFGILDSQTETARTIYLLAAIISFHVILFVRLWIWIQMNKNATVREILRLELRLIEIQKSLGKD